MKPVCALLFAFCLAAQTQAPQSGSRNPVGTGVQDPIVDFYDSMADYFRNSQRAVQAIGKKGIPDQEVPAVLLIARRSSASPNQIIEMRQGGKSWAEIAKQNKVNISGTDFVTEANIIFLSEYHGRPAEQIRALHAKGATFIQLNQEFRRDGSSRPPRATEKPAAGTQKQ